MVAVRSIHVLAVATLITQPEPAFAADVYASVGNWTVGYDSSVRGCYASAVYEGAGETVLRIGVDIDDGTFFIAVQNDNWRSLREGDQHELSVKFGNRPAWTGPATVVTSGTGLRYLRLNFDETLFFREFASQPFVAISFNGREIERLKLTDSARATLKLIECQRRRNAVDVDPFKGVTPKNNNTADPFEI